MPRVDGWEVLRRMRASPRTARLPVVVVSSSDRPEDIQRCYALGANSYLLKRFDPRGPGTYLAEAARYWIEMNQVIHELEPLSW
jgi:CheY-like chemotaxis protein